MYAHLPIVLPLQNPRQWKLTAQDMGPLQAIVTSPPPPPPPPENPQYSQLLGPEGHTWHWPCTFRKPSGLNPGLWASNLTFHSDLKARMELDGCQGEGRPASNSLFLSPVPRTRWMDVSPPPQNNSIFLILPFSTSFTLSSYFTTNMWEIPPPLTRKTHIYVWLALLLLVLWWLWSILSKSVCAKMGNRLDHFDMWISIYVFFFSDGSPEGQRQMWFHV